MRIWIDITNTPHINAFLPIIKELEKEHEIIISARDFSEVLPRLKQLGFDPIITGGHKGKSRLKKIFGSLERLIQLSRIIPAYDVSMSFGPLFTAPLSFLRRKVSILFSDNDITKGKLTYRLGKNYIFPKYYNASNLPQKVVDDKAYFYDGFKEDIYIADYIPDETFLEQLPFKDFITIRPENLKAVYVPKGSKTIVPELFEKFKNEKILYLPRFKEEVQYAKGYNNIFIPSVPLNGLDVCYYTRVMLTGAGTFAREAALIGTPAVSFYPGAEFLTVDLELQKRGWEFFSRNPEEIAQYVSTETKREFDISRSKYVLKEVLDQIQLIISRLDQ